MFPLAFDPATGKLASGGALAGGILQALSHATAKAAMFMSAGLMYAALGHDRIAGLSGAARVLPVTVVAFGLGGVALIGLPSSGAYLAKDLFLGAATQTGQWWWAIAIQTGGILTSSYVLLVLAYALAPSDRRLHTPISRLSEAAALGLAMLVAARGCSLGGISSNRTRYSAESARRRRALKRVLAAPSRRSVGHPTGTQGKCGTLREDRCDPGPSSPRGPTLWPVD
jgi:NADH:ubiquinone oxidoreductase subunit 5 (subunit L)/multisubunit Na+/H+ antiporter MnhA subunit